MVTGDGFSAVTVASPMDFSGNLAIEWKRWRQRFEIYLTASGRQESTDKGKSLSPSSCAWIRRHRDLQYIHSDGGGADEFRSDTTKVSQSFRTKTEYHIRTSPILHPESETRRDSRSVCYRPSHSRAYVRVRDIEGLSHQRPYDMRSGGHSSYGETSKNY